MIEVIEPTDVLVYGRIPPDIFEDFHNLTKFHRYPSEFEMAHMKEVK